jgi:hypothetical protein
VQDETVGDEVSQYYALDTEMTTELRLPTGADAFLIAMAFSFTD